MAISISEKNIFSFAIFFSLLVVIFYFFVIFLKQNYWWITLTFFYLIFFVYREINLKRKEFNERLRLKDRREIRINFWG
jgi:Ca2+/Na+ antiporter